MEGEREGKLYREVLEAKVSQNCCDAAKEYFQIIAPLCPENPSIAADLLRLAVRPLFYMGITEKEALLFYIYEINKERPEFYDWLKLKEDLIVRCLKELEILSCFYDLEYDDKNNRVVLKNANALEVSAERKFQSFLEFKGFLMTFFKINEKEMDRIILEEGFLDIFKEII